MSGGRQDAAPAAPGPQFPEYGEGGDHVGARRVRRSFRMAVAGMFGLTLALWLAENYLRYDLVETQFRMALTLPDDSSRAVLRNVVRRDASGGHSPDARYVEALAFIEEDDVILQRYEEAYKLNPTNSFLLINYGCRLFQDRKFAEARERFREAGAQPPRNALPRYLEAAALAAAAPNGDLSDAFVLIERNNTTADPVIFPKPVWHDSLPREGAWYGDKERQIVRLCLAPLFDFENQVVARARRDIEAGREQKWDSWLERMQGLGARLAGEGGAKPEHDGAVRTLAGISIQRDALKLRNDLRARGGNGDPAMAQRAAKLDDARTRLADFENSRDDLIKAHRGTLVLPYALAGLTFFALGVCYFISYILSRFAGRRRAAWVLPHNATANAIFAGGPLVFLAVLFAAALAQRAGPAGAAWVNPCTNLWSCVLAFLLIAGPLYPAFRLPAARKVAVRAAEGADPASVLPEVRRSRRAVFIMLLRRYYGVVLGGLLASFCLWFMLFRVLRGMYPWPIALLETGLRSQELDVLRQVREMLQ